MHIPDGYLSPQTCAVGLAVAVPAVAIASRRVGSTLRTRHVPQLAMFSAVSFLVMMFNIPVPDGTSAHAVGAVLVAIALGPWAAVVAVSVALLFQALLFGDGGVLAYGVNVTTMAVLMPFLGYAVYRLVAGRSALTSRRRLVAAFLGGFVGVNAAGLATAVALGVQPLLFHAADGTPLYSPYSLGQAVPAIMLAHVLVAGPVEGLLTAGVLAYLARTNPDLVRASHPGLDAVADGPARPSRLTPARASLGVVAALALLSPLGLLAPGGAFGEDAPADLPLSELGLDAIPAGMQRYAGFWEHTVLGGYGFRGGEHPVLAYWVSAVVGIAVVGAAVYALGLALRVARRRRLPA